MEFKETTLTSLTIILAATVLVAIGKIDPQWWAVSVSAAGLGKGIQGAADRFKPHANPSTNKE